MNSYYLDKLTKISKLKMNELIMNQLSVKCQYISVSEKGHERGNKLEIRSPNRE
jgi:hypothetical protein